MGDFNSRFNPDEYSSVEERISLFWSKYPNGRIVTEMLALDSEQAELRLVVVKASVYKDFTSDVAATGLAKERDGGSGASKTSFIENAETSAIGRALANLGFAVKKRPSKEEMEAAQRVEEAHLEALQGLKKLAAASPEAKKEIQPEWEKIKDNPTASVALLTKLNKRYAKVTSSTA
jgi:hypothetical protein